MAPNPRLGALAAVAVATVAMASAATAQAQSTTPCDATPTITGTSGNDRLRGTSGRDVIDGRGGNDVIQGRGGNDLICGGDGADKLSGGPGDDVIDGGGGSDTVRGGPGADTIVDAPGTLSAIIDAQERDQLRDWAAARTIATINSGVTDLTQERRDAIPAIVLNSNAEGDARAKLLRVMTEIVNTPGLGFYAEIWSYTVVEMTPGGFFGTCNHLFLDPDAFNGLSDHDARNVFGHESFHSFDCVNGGPAGALDEGAAIWVVKSFLEQTVDPAETWAEATYGTKLFYRDINGQPDYPLQVAQNPTQKLLDVYAELSARDPSKLPWNSQDRLSHCYQAYFESLNRNVDFFTVWLPSVKLATDAMLADPQCRPL
jgi:hypothetical protein